MKNFVIWTWLSISAVFWCAQAVAANSPDGSLLINDARFLSSLDFLDINQLWKKISGKKKITLEVFFEKIKDDLKKNKFNSSSTNLERDKSNGNSVLAYNVSIETIPRNWFSENLNVSELSTGGAIESYLDSNLKSQVLFPILITNRLDLGDKSGWAKCGQVNIVYSFAKPIRVPGKPKPLRLFINFEFAVPNIKSARKQDCVPVANAWREIGNTHDQNEKAEKLETLLLEPIFSGERIISWQNLGGRFGQIRMNGQSADNGDWFMREWELVKEGASFNVKAYPLQNTTRSTFVTGSVDSSNNSLRKLFRDEFLTKGIEALISTDKIVSQFGKEEYRKNLINRITTGESGHDRYNNFESNIDASKPLLRVVEYNKEFKNGIRESIKNVKNNVNLQNIANRMGLLSCTGCHHSTGKEKIASYNGTPILWPKSFEFVHVCEPANGSCGNNKFTSELSPAMTDFFLDYRLSVLKEILSGKKDIFRAKTSFFRAH